MTQDLDRTCHVCDEEYPVEVFFSYCQLEILGFSAIWFCDKQICYLKFIYIIIIDYFIEENP